MKTLFRLTRPQTHRLTSLALIAAFCFPSLAATPERFELKDGDRVLFMGDTFIEREEIGRAHV